MDETVVLNIELRSKIAEFLCLTSNQKELKRQVPLGEVQAVSSINEPRWGWDGGSVDTWKSHSPLIFYKLKSPGDC